MLRNDFPVESVNVLKVSASLNSLQVKEIKDKIKTFLKECPSALPRSKEPKFISTIGSSEQRTSQVVEVSKMVVLNIVISPNDEEWGLMANLRLPQVWNHNVKKVHFWTSGPSQHNLPSGSDLQREMWRRRAKEHLCQGAKQFSNNMNIFYAKIEGAIDWEPSSRLQRGDNLYLIFKIGSCSN